MARANHGADFGAAHPILGAAAWDGLSAGLHPEHADWLGRRRGRAARFRPLLASHHRNLQIRLRQAYRSRRRFTE